VLFNLLETFGPEIMPTPNIDTNLTKMLLKMTNVDDLGLGKFSDADPEKISDIGKMNY
jgi:hypothetical protein